MKKVRIGLLQGNFRNAFDEEFAQIREVSDHRDTLTECDFEFNQNLVIKLIRQAAKNGAQIVLTPESYLDGWSVNPEILEK